MRFSVTFHPVAAVELRTARSWYRSRNIEAGRAFARNVSRGIGFVAENPFACQEHEDGTRRMLVRGFPYLIIYRLAGAEVRVIAVAHASREPGFWRTRPGS